MHQKLEKLDFSQVLNFGTVFGTFGAEVEALIIPFVLQDISLTCM
jgi:hypothetical protein